MIVKELIELLETLDPNLTVIMSKDSEGNSFSPFNDFSIGCYSPESSWYGDWEDAQDQDWKHPQDFGYSSVCLWPIN